MLAYDAPEQGPVCFCDQLCFVFSDCCPGSCNVCGSGCDDLEVDTPAAAGAMPALGPKPATPVVEALMMDADYFTLPEEDAEGEGDDEGDDEIGQCSQSTCGKGINTKAGTCFCDVNCVKNNDCCNNFVGSECDTSSPQLLKVGPDALTSP